MLHFLLHFSNFSVGIFHLTEWKQWENRQFPPKYISTTRIEEILVVIWIYLCYLTKFYFKDLFIPGTSSMLYCQMC